MSVKTNIRKLFADFTCGDGDTVGIHAKLLVIDVREYCQALPDISARTTLMPLMSELEALGQTEPRGLSASEDFAGEVFALHNRILVTLGHLAAADAQLQQNELARKIQAVRQGRPERVAAALATFTLFTVEYDRYRAWADQLQQRLSDAVKTSTTLAQLKEATALCYSEQEEAIANYHERAIGKAMKGFLATIYGEKLDLGSYHIFPSGTCVFRTPSPEQTLELTPARLFDLRWDVYLVLKGAL